MTSLSTMDVAHTGNMEIIDMDGALKIADIFRKTQCNESTWLQTLSCCAALHCLERLVCGHASARWPKCPNHRSNKETNNFRMTLAPLWSLFFRLEFYEHFDYKQDKSLSSVRLVCKNATKVLKRKDSSGSILKDGYVKKSDFTWVFVCSQLEGWD